MPPKTQRRSNQSPALATRQRVQHNTHSDFDSDVQTAIPTLQTLSQIPQAPERPQISRTNEALNLSVLQRHNPSITRVLSISSYVVIYTFSPLAQTWEKSGVEGTLFICQLSPPVGFEHTGLERYSVVVLNRHGLNNFETELTREKDVDIKDPFVELHCKSSDSTGDSDDEDVQDDGANRVIHSVWIWAEAAPSASAQNRETNARLIKDCAAQAEASRKGLELGKPAEELPMSDGWVDVPQFAQQSGQEVVEFEDDGQLRDQNQGMGYGGQPGMFHSHPQRPGFDIQHQLGYDSQQDTGYGAQGNVYDGAPQEMGYDGQRHSSYDNQGGYELRHEMVFGNQGHPGHGGQQGMHQKYISSTRHNGQGRQSWELQGPLASSRPANGEYPAQESPGMDSKGPDVLGDLFRKARQGYSSMG